MRQNITTSLVLSQNNFELKNNNTYNIFMLILSILLEFTIPFIAYFKPKTKIYKISPNNTYLLFLSQDYTITLYSQNKIITK